METLGLLAPQRNRRAVDPELERIPANRAAQERELGAFHEAEHHEPLDGRVGRVYGFDAHAVTGLEVGQGQKRSEGTARK